ncbi:MAG: hypothetical protein GYA33_14260 [Thermogutta sp.]|nr:hypothetical protein [Thermogutta sp.]
MRRLLQEGEGRNRRREYTAGDRRGAAATLDYVLVMGVILPAAAFSMWAGPRIIRLAYEMVYVLLVWPFM